MNRDEARAIADATLTRLRDLPYPSLVERFLDKTERSTALGDGASRYEVEVQGFWDRGTPGDIRILASVDDGRWRAFAPLSCDFIMAPDGSLVGE